MARKLDLIFMEPSKRLRRTDSDWWALGWDTDLASDPGVDRWYEIHHRRVWHSGMTARLCEPDRYAGWLSSLKGPKYLAQVEPDVKDSHAFPFAEISAMPGVGNYLCSSMGMMLCHGVLEGYKDIGIYGCDFEHPEWQELLFEKPNLAYLMGLFRAQGVKITVPQRSALWELELLDELSYVSDRSKTVYLEYMRGHLAGKQISRDGFVFGDTRNHPYLPWTDPWPYYGAQTLEDCGATPQRYAAELRREMGIVV